MCLERFEMFSNILNNFKGDLEEFVSTVKNDATQVLHSTLGGDNENQSTARVGGTPLKPQVIGATSPIPADFVAEEQASIAGSLASGDGFEQFKNSFEFSTSGEKNASLLASNSILSVSYNQLVPSTLTEQEFFTRYYYLKHLERIHKLRQAQVVATTEEDIGWSGDEDEGCDSTFADNAHENINAEEIQHLEAENKRLKSDYETLEVKVKEQADRIAELERLLAQHGIVEDSTTPDDVTPAPIGAKTIEVDVEECPSAKQEGEVELAINSRSPKTVGAAKNSDEPKPTPENKTTFNEVETEEEGWDDWE